MLATHKQNIAYSKIPSFVGFLTNLTICVIFIAFKSIEKEQTVPFSCSYNRFRTFLVSNIQAFIAKLLQNVHQYPYHRVYGVLSKF